jgi:hypothetical protein
MFFASSNLVFGQLPYKTFNATGTGRSPGSSADVTDDGLDSALENPDPNNDGYDEDAFDADNDGIKDYLDPNNFVPSSNPDPSRAIEVYNALSPN